VFRLIITGAEEGAYNMAVDSAIIEKFKVDSVLPTIRFFWFDPPCVSIGRLQCPDSLCNMGYYLVRRPTGGRAVVHKDDLSYSIVCKRDNPVFGGNVLETFMKSSRLLVEAVRLLGIDAEIVRARSGSERPPLCFQSKSRYEVVSDGEFILLQGSISLDLLRETIIDKYRLVLSNRGIGYAIDTLTKEEKALALHNTPMFRIDNIRTEKLKIKN
jgi:lipoate-protein ligase A